MFTEFEGWLTSRVYIYTFIVLFLVTGATLFWVAVVRPRVMDAEREGNIRSHGYVEARRTEVFNLVDECGRLNVSIAQAQTANQPDVADAMQSQKQALYSRVRRALSEFPVDGRSLDVSPCN